SLLTRAQSDRPPRPGRIRRKTRSNVALVIVAVPLVVILIAVVTGSWLAPVDPRPQDLLLGASGPSGEHWIGTDDLGRDVLSRLVAGARPAVIGPLIVAIVTITIGTWLGLLAAYRGGRYDAAIS